MNKFEPKWFKAFGKGHFVVRVVVNGQVNDKYFEDEADADFYINTWVKQTSTTG